MSAPWHSKPGNLIRKHCCGGDSSGIRSGENHSPWQPADKEAVLLRCSGCADTLVNKQILTHALADTRATVWLIGLHLAGLAGWNMGPGWDLEVAMTSSPGTPASSHKGPGCSVLYSSSCFSTPWETAGNGSSSWTPAPRGSQD